MARSLSLAALVFACGAALAQQPPGATPMQHAPNRPWVRGGEGAPARAAGHLGRTDRKFVEAAAQAGLAEIAQAQLAMQRANDPTIRAFAAQLVKDHQAANVRLQQIATAKGVALPQGPSKKQQHELRDLQRLSGEAFDKRFLQRMSDDHQKAIDLFGHEIKGRHQDADLKSFAQQTLIGLERHLAQVHSLQKSAGGVPGA